MDGKLESVEDVEIEVFRVCGNLAVATGSVGMAIKRVCGRGDQQGQAWRVWAWQKVEI